MHDVIVDATEGQATPAIRLAPSVIEDLVRRRVTSARLMGSCAIAYRCRTHWPIWVANARGPIGDIDVAVRRREMSLARRSLTALGYIQSKDMIRHSTRYDRLLFFPPQRSWPAIGRPPLIEVFPSPLAFHHTIHVAPWDITETLTLPLTELFLSKCQYAMLLPSDLTDLCLILLESASPSSPSEPLIPARVANACRRDWGLSHTIRRNLVFILRFARKAELLGNATLIRDTVQQIRSAIKTAPKTQLWHLSRRYHETSRCVPSGRIVEDSRREEAWRSAS